MDYFRIFESFVITAFIPIVVIIFVSNLVTYGARRETFYRCISLSLMIYMIAYSLMKGVGIV